MEKELEQILPFSKKHLKSYAVLELLNKTMTVQNHIVLNPERTNDDIYDIGLGLQQRSQTDIDCDGYRGWLIAQMVVYRKLGIPKYFKLGEQLYKRKLDRTSSQWASARILCGEKINDNRLSCQIARECMKLWEEGNPKFDQVDQTELNQWRFFLFGDKLDLNNPENMPLAVLFNIISMEKALLLHPTLKHHESDRSIEINEAERQLRNGTMISTSDHRIVKAIAMYAKKRNVESRFANPNCVSKSNPKFWDMLNQSAKRLYQ